MVFKKLFFKARGGCPGWFVVGVGFVSSSVFSLGFSSEFMWISFTFVGLESDSVLLAFLGSVSAHHRCTFLVVFNLRRSHAFGARFSAPSTIPRTPIPSLCGFSSSLPSSSVYFGLFLSLYSFGLILLSLFSVSRCLFITSNSLLSSFMPSTL